MKNIIIFVGLISFLLITSCSHNPEKILKKSLDKCRSIENGFYKMNHYMKYMYSDDTTNSSYTCYFKKITNDSIYSSAFHLKLYYNGKYGLDLIYNGNELVTYWENDSVGEIMLKKLWASDIKNQSRKYKYYSPLFNKLSYPLPTKDYFSDNKYEFQFEGEETINKSPCYIVKMTNHPKIDTNEITKVLQIKYQYWINKSDYIPIQYTIIFTLEEYGDTIYQYEKYSLTNYNLNNLTKERISDILTPPSFINLKEYQPFEVQKLLPINSFAPNWSLTTVDEKIISLHDLKDSLILIDFFYKECQPCQLALPVLQNLHEKYHKKGLKIIGIDPYDTKEKDNIDKYLSDRGISYTVLLEGKQVSKQYHVHGYPTFYLIDKNKRIIMAKVGYSEETEKTLENLIIEHLK